jgi:PKD repeat protein
MKKAIPVLIFALIVLWAGCNKDDDNDETLAKFSWTLSQTPGEVNFTNESTNAQTYEWNFGDGSASTQKNPVHGYDQNGTYVVSLKAFGQGIGVTSDTLLIENIP